MKIPSLVWYEIVHRKLNFAIGLLSVIVAVACSVGVITLIHGHEIHTSGRVAALDDEIRKITKNMGFNITILPKDQNMLDFHASDFADKTMPYDFVKKLADSPDIITVNHLRPALIRRMDWNEKNRQILLMGVSGIVPFAHRDPKKPLTQPVPPGTMNVGSVLANELGLKQGEEVTLNGEALTVGKVYPQRGTKDDITVWIDLAVAQRMLNLTDRINMIQALECNCASIDRLAEILGDEVQVIEFATTAIARAKAREGVKAAGKTTIDRLQRLASVVLPLVIVGASVLVGLLSLANVRERRAEIGILRALGTRSLQVFGLFVTKAVILGVLGAGMGYLVGHACGLVGIVRLEGTQEAATQISFATLFQLPVLIAVLILAPALAVLASWIPAMSAARQDPAVVLREE